MSTTADSGPLAHAGALATAIWVFCTVYDYRRHLDAGEAKVAQIANNLEKYLPITGKESAERLNKKAQANTQRAGRVIGWSQAALLIAATLVWGFADIAPKYAPFFFKAAPAENERKCQ